MAKILKIYPDNPQENLINEVIKTLNNGGLIIYPSDTVYALGCNIFDIKAMEKLAQIKKIKLEKSKFSIICNDLSIFRILQDRLTLLSSDFWKAIFRDLLPSFWMPIKVCHWLTKDTKQSESVFPIIRFHN